MAHNDDPNAPIPFPSHPQPVETSGLTERIHIPDWDSARDFTPSDLARILRQFARLANYLGGNVMRTAALANSPHAGGAAHPVTQAIFNIAAQAESAAVQLEGPSRIMPVGGGAGPIGRA